MISDVAPVVPEDASRLLTLHQVSGGIDSDALVSALKRDQVVLVRNVEPAEADDIVSKVAQAFDLKAALEMQAAFADFQGHRKRASKYYMTVNRRADYQFITPHSEGTSFINMQLASFYCYENTTDGGETIVFNVDSASRAWDSLRETVTRARLAGRALTRGDIAKAKIYGVNLPEDLLNDEEVIRETSATIRIPGLEFFEALARPKQTYSKILDQKVFGYWDSVASIDLDAVSQYAELLRCCDLLKQPASGLELTQLDNAWSRRIRGSGVKYSQLFRCKLTHKLGAKDLLIQNNLTWAHSVSNWTPGSGIRKVTAAFS
jgi:hypothetical protein